jgi:hypothetical protein
MSFLDFALRHVRKRDRNTGRDENDDHKSGAPQPGDLQPAM